MFRLSGDKMRRIDQIVLYFAAGSQLRVNLHTYISQAAEMSKYMGNSKTNTTLLLNILDTKT